MGEILVDIQSASTVLFTLGYKSTDYASLAAAVSAIGSSPATLYINRAETVTSDLVIPDTLSVVMVRPGLITVSSGKTLTINGQFRAGLFQVFAGEGVVSLGNSVIAEVYPEWWGAIADGTTDSSGAFQKANDSIITSGGKIQLGAGIYLASFIVDSFVTVTGLGINITKIKTPNNANKDTIQGRNFVTLTSTVKATPENRGVRYFNLKDLTLDGNKDNNVTGFGIRIWGCSLSFQNIIVQNCAEDGIWTEFTTHDDPTGSSDPSHEALESTFFNIKTLSNGGNGWTFKGPHDSVITNFITFGNGGWGLEQLTVNSNIKGSDWNSWLNTTGSFYVGSSMQVHDIVASGPYTGVGIELAAGTGSSKFTNLTIGGHLTGLILRGADHIIHGQVLNCRNPLKTAGNGIEFDGSINCLLDVVMSGCFNYFKFTSEAGRSVIRGIVQHEVGETLFSPVMPNTDHINLVTNGAGAAGAQVVCFPIGTFTIAGWSPTFPLTNGHIPSSGGGTTGGAGSAGAGNQFVEIEVSGVKYKILHDGIIP